MMKKTIKRPMKKADGGPIGTMGIRGGRFQGNKPGMMPGGIGRGIDNDVDMMRGPSPNPMALQRANENARFNRPATGGPLPPVQPKMPTMARAMPMRKAKGGAASKEKWIQGAIKHPGALRESLGVKKGEKIPMAKLQKATHSKNPTTVKRANLAMTLRGMKKK